MTITNARAMHHLFRFACAVQWQSMRLRPLALPYEHGAWGFLLEPIAVGLLVAPSAAGALLALATVAAFLARHPLRLVTRDVLQGKRHPRTIVCSLFALAYASASLAALAGAFVLGGAIPLLPLLAVPPVAGVQFALDVRNQGRTLLAELTGAAAPGAAAMAIVLAASHPPALAFALWALLAARALASILYVRCTLRGEPRRFMLAAHLAAVALAIALVPVVGAGAIAAMLVLLLRALPLPNLSARQIGMRELGYGTLAVLLIALA
jgi:hypothetical protein